LAACHPHLNQNALSPPDFVLNERINPAAVQLKVRFWVNGDGFVTRAFVIANRVVPQADQGTALDYVQHLSFMVPNTEECQTRQMEMLGNFLESRESGGEWATVFEVHPRYSLEGNRVVQNR
jgi:hypothetical protein